MGVQQPLGAFLFQVSIVFVMFLIVSASEEHKKARGRHSSRKDHNSKMSPRLQFEITLHGLLLWASMAFLLPVGILVIRLSNREGNRRRLRIIFYVHAALQKLAVLLATAGAVMSIKNFNNSFDNSHQRLGVALYGIMWLQVLVGIFRPQRGSKRRSLWFFAHWIMGTTVSLLGVLNVFIGLQAYREKTSKSITTWNILFSVQICLIVIFYLLQEKWVYIQNQGVV
ncbi:cytochrome b561 domain-containing protein At4g18260 [Vigna radiata var. radiata]|uniref:Cytochrome b561 domain-containing protein At4g18260 n=1 Tax=Vigna radiata var. radiata TaxID=3916 RepID=A0A3Q0F593_VIGRR|nr:cytochrome b561 domain-containing protein At4g18260 [Vigna radiata var. radiata]XP_022637583.1 cytochrome b561 domain-containing protein At4g18260 [Vigna radiata var. radiata]XP_022637584.1 cytochrome b561 domain-containing protein At4g18260 [Vigna radiata var. radiata]XP_022637585.1 cytochrome b561 domain-containing protein At4g18260 [Vigna radiata var. radiata]